MSFEIVTTKERFMELQKDWNELLERSIDNQIFYRWEWYSSFIENLFNNDSELSILLLWNNKKKLLAIAPLKIIPKKVMLKKYKLLTFILEEYVDYSSFMIDSNENEIRILKKIFKEIQNLENWDLMQLNNISDKYGLNNTLSYAIKNTTNFFSSYINVTAPYFHFQDMKSNKSQMSDVRRKEKKLNEKYSVNIKINDKFSEEIYNKLVEYHMSEYDGSIFHNQEVNSFYKNACLKLKDNLEMSYIKLNNSIVAIHFGFKDKNKFYYFIPKFDRKYSRDAVGIILLKNMVDHYSKSLMEFDTLRGEEVYKFNFADKISSNYSFLLASNSNKSFIIKIYINLFTAFKTVPFFKNLYNKMKK